MTALLSPTGPTAMVATMPAVTTIPAMPGVVTMSGVVPMPATRAEDRASDRAESERLAAGFVRGDEESFALVYRRWGALVYSLAARSLGDAREAEDVAQQTFLAAWRGRHGYHALRGPLPGWLVGIARTTDQRKISPTVSPSVAST
ncbi:hypothetical protein I3W98_39690, partial [Streptomyces cavourensis]|nr:hypothetical protein [Streptomyces cavourensis]